MRVPPAPLVGLFLLVTCGPALGQAPECAAYVSSAQRVCAAAVDGTRAFHPVVGVLVSGGNPTIGSAATMGGLGHASFTLRFNAVEVVLPDLAYNGSNAAVPAGDKVWAPAPLLEGALGIYRGMPSGLFAVDLLASAQLLPTDPIDDFTVNAGARRIGDVALGLGYGARLGLLRELGPLPAVSVSIMRRDIPQISYGDVSTGDRYSYNVDMHATNLRLVASKKLLAFDLAGGVGWDNYSGDAVIRFRDPLTGVTQPNLPVELDNSRVLGFLNAGISLSVLRLTGEIGYQGGRNQELSTAFEDFDTTKGKFFAGLGLRMGFAPVDEREAMSRALDLALRGWGKVQQDPLVGAVVLKDGQPVGEGWHPEFGARHAETVALAEAGELASGATLVVTLEPCTHHGKQPPCTDAIIQAGISRVVAAMPDPNPLAAGGGEQLRQAGIEVEFGPLSDAAAILNAMFLHALRQPDRPYVALKLATTLDGRIADAFGRSRWISGDVAREYVQWLRAGFDAIAIGGRTARLDDPALTVRGPVRPRTPPRRVIFDRVADLGPHLTLLRTANETPTLVVVGSDADPVRVKRLESTGVTVIRAGSLAAALGSLKEQGVGSLLVEGGGQLAGALLEAGVVDRYYWLQAPMWLGEGGVPGLAGLPTRALDQAERWRVVERRPLGDDTLLVLDRR